MIISAKELGADVSSTGAKVTTTNLSTNNTSDGDQIVYAGDPRIKAIWASGNEWKFAMLAVNFLDYLIKQNVLDGEKIKALLDTGSTGDSSSLYGAIKKLSDIDQNDEAQQSPKTANDVRRYYEFFKKSGNSTTTSNTDQSAPTNAAVFGKKLGMFAGESDANAMFLTTAIDMDYLYVPFTATGLKAVSLVLTRPQFSIPTAVGVDFTYRDYLLSETNTTNS